MRCPKFLGLTVLLCLAVLAGGCATRTTRQVLQDDEKIRLLLRGKTHSRQPIDRGYSHPLTIAPARMAHALSRIDVRLEDGKHERKSAIPTELLYDLGDALSSAFAKADSSQEIVGWVTETRTKAGLFHEKRLTSFIAYAKDELIHIHFYRVDWKLPEHAADEDPFEPQLDQKPAMEFQVLASEGMAITQANALAIDWKHDVFRTPSRVQISPTGKVLRREILMQSEEDEALEPKGGSTPELSGSLSPEALRKLADLETARREGRISEAEYQSQRRQTLQADPSLQSK